MRTRRQGPPEVWFQILHVAPVGHNGVSEAQFYEQTVEIALGPKGAFENGSVGTLKRRVTADRVVNAAAKVRRSAMPPRAPRTPPVVELLRKAQEWQRQLDAGDVTNQAEIARREGVTRARVTQIMGMLRLAPEIQARIQAMPDGPYPTRITEHALRSILRMGDVARQYAVFAELAGRSG